MPDNFFSKCAPLVRPGIDSCAGLTTCNLSPTTAQDFEEIYKDTAGRWRVMGALFETDIMAKACQIQENPLYTFIRANSRDWGSRKLTASPTVGSGLIDIQPFIRVKRNNLINNTYWKWTKTGNSGTVSGITYDIAGTAESLTGIPADVNWFPARRTIHISGKSDAGSSTNTQWIVVYAAVAANNRVTIYLRSQNAGSSLAADKLSTPVTGVLMRGVNNISPYESDCNQIPRLNTTSTYLAFVQHSRWSLCNDEMTQKFKKYIFEGNPLYREYYHVEEGEYNRQLLADWQNSLVHSFLFGKPLPNQDENNWPQLEVIESWSDGLTGDHIYLNGVEGRCVGRRAAAEGVYEQLNRCGRVKDLQGEVLNFPELQQALYELHRLRRQNGVPNSDVIEIVVDSAFRVHFITALMRYLKLRYDDMLHFTKSVDNSKQTDLGFVYEDFKLDFPAGVTLRVTSHIALDDFVSAHRNVDSSLTNTGRWMLMLDWSNIYMANIASETVELETGDIKDLAKINSDAFCRMRIPKKSIKHNALMWTTVVECPATSLWFENFAFEVPEHENKYGNPNLPGKGGYNDYAGNDPSNDA